jgi:hypothetical protein
VIAFDAIDVASGQTEEASGRAVFATDADPGSRSVR